MRIVLLAKTHIPTTIFSNILLASVSSARPVVLLFLSLRDRVSYPFHSSTPHTIHLSVCSVLVHFDVVAVVVVLILHGIPHALFAPLCARGVALCSIRRRLPSSRDPRRIYMYVCICMYVYEKVIDPRVERARSGRLVLSIGLYYTLAYTYVCTYR